MENEQNYQYDQPLDKMEEEEKQEQKRNNRLEDQPCQLEDDFRGSHISQSHQQAHESEEKGVFPLFESQFFSNNQQNDMILNFMKQGDDFKHQIGLYDLSYYNPLDFDNERQNEPVSFFDKPKDPSQLSSLQKENQEIQFKQPSKKGQQSFEIIPRESEERPMEIEETHYGDDILSTRESSRFQKLMVQENQSTFQLLTSKSLAIDDESTLPSKELITQGQEDLSTKQNTQSSSQLTKNYQKIKFGQKYLTKQDQQQLVDLLNPNSPISFLPLRMYIYLDIVLDLGFIKEMNSQEEYVRSNHSEQLYSGMKSIVKQVHRLDTKSIEIHNEFSLNHIHLLKYLVEYLMSQQDKRIHKEAQTIEIFRNNIENFRAAIKAQGKDIEFKKHQKLRQKACNKEFKRITSEIKNDELIFYVRFAVNYLKGTLESNLSGYSEGLQDFIFGSSYAFQKHISEKGYYDPMGKLFKLRDCYYNTVALTGFQYSQTKIDEGYSQYVDLITMEGFCFPCANDQQYITLSANYDQENGLNCMFSDLLIINTFTLNDPTAMQFLKEERIEQSLLLNVENIATEDDNQLAVDLSEKDYAKTLFFRKYYIDQIPNLVRVGNKWNKRCGFIDIPIKKANS